MTTPEMRTQGFARNPILEGVLTGLNARLAGDRRAPPPDHPPCLFIVGPLRSGTTLLLQWLAGDGGFAYPSNLISRFWNDPVTGLLVQRMLCDPACDFRGELGSLHGGIDFASENGKTRGALAPNEFWYFWRRFLPFQERDWASADEMARLADAIGLSSALADWAAADGRPLAMKAMILNQNLDWLAEAVPRSLFLWCQRDPALNMQSALQARLRQHGDLAHWYSFRIREQADLAGLPPLAQVAGQIRATHDAIARGLAGIGTERVIAIDHAEFCRDPAGLHRQIRDRIAALWPEWAPGRNYHGPACFHESRDWTLAWCTRNEAEAAWAASGTGRQ